MTAATNLGLPDTDSKQIKRDDDGLIKGLDYVFNEDGLIDWRKMVKKEFLVANRDRTNESDVTKLEDNKLLILLGGIKELAQIRGYTNVQYSVQTPSSDYVVATCSITWIPNFETEGREVTFSAIGDASPDNTKSFARFFLGPIAENRAFVRCVRNFLKINIVGQDEIGESKLVASESNKKENLTDPCSILEALMTKKGVSFEKIKEKLVKEEVKGAADFGYLNQIPRLKIFELIERLKKAKAKA
jgi:hypothetical protein